MVLDVLSMGGGVQSTAILVLVAQNKLPKPDLVVFCDTGSELPQTLTHIKDRLIPLAESLDIPFNIVRYTNKKGASEPLYKHYMDRSLIPAPISGQCTRLFKIIPFKRHIRSIVGRKNKKILARAWLGITTDESHRANTSGVGWYENHFPLLDLELSRDNCINILEEYGWGDTVKSGCFHCHYQSAKQWQALKRKHPDLFKISLDMEKKALERGFKGGLWGGSKSITGFDVESLERWFALYSEDPIPLCNENGGCFL